MSESSTDISAESSRDDPAAQIEHVTVEEDGVGVCTMYPVECSEAEMATRWIAAESGSFVALEAVC